jgi:8-hydroxy-5-deazaflavin:NADPH oxidoreductase
MKQTIAVIGAGDRMIRDYVKSLSKENCRILLYSDDPEEAGEFLREIKEVTPSADVEIYPCRKEASWESDIIIFALPVEDSDEAIRQIKEVSCRKKIIVPDETTVRYLKPLLPNSEIVKLNSFSTEL